MKRMRRCPFCGSGEARLFILPFSGDYDNPSGWYVGCETSDYGCGASGPIEWTKEAAVEAWNNRPLFDLEKLKNDIECLKTVDDSLRMVDDEMTLCMMRIDDIQRAINQGIIDLISILDGYTE